jgi:hypothetical protein
VADYQVPARIRRLRIEDRQPPPGLSVVGADLLVVRGDPVSSIAATRSVALVIKSGRIVFPENPSLPPPGL